MSGAIAAEPGVRFDVVVPTIGRPSLTRLLRALDRAVDPTVGPAPHRVVVVDDRADSPVPIALPDGLGLQVVVRTTGGRGPATARNAGARAGAADWIAFLDDDVEPTRSWTLSLMRDLAAVPPSVGAVTGRVVVPEPRGRRPTDAERGVIALQGAAWITADLAVRREAFESVGGYDERFRRAYREDTDFALRLMDAGWTIAAGERAVVHPTRQGTWWSSVHAQRGNADDALMRRLHGADWRARGRAPRGMIAFHVATTAVAAAGVMARLLGRRRLAGAAGRTVAACVAVLWVRRTLPGPRSIAEWSRMMASSALIPFAATWFALAGRMRAARLAPAGAGDRWGVA